MLGHRASEWGSCGTIAGLALWMLAMLLGPSCGLSLAAGQHEPVTVELLPLGDISMGEQHDSTYWVEGGDALVLTWTASAPIDLKIFGPGWDVVLELPSTRSDLTALTARMTGHHTVRWTNPSASHGVTLTYSHDVRPSEEPAGGRPADGPADDGARDRKWAEALTGGTLIFLMMLLALVVQLFIQKQEAGLIYRPVDADDLFVAFSATSPLDAQHVMALERPTSGPDCPLAGPSEEPSPAVRVLRA